MSEAPWDAIPEDDTLFVLVTGANSGVGLGICQRLIDEFFSTRSPKSHLIVIPTARSAQKLRDTTNNLREHAKKLADTVCTNQAQPGSEYTPQDITRRFHVVGLQLDLCSLPSVHQAAAKLATGTFSIPSDDDFFEPLDDVRIPRLDSVVFNAGNGCFTGVHWPKVAYNILTTGLPHAVTWPTFKLASAGTTVRPIPSSGGDQDEPGEWRMGEVFCSNVFGHYVLGNVLTPLLSRPAGSPLPTGRIVWESSIEPHWTDLDLDDFQALNTNAAYESSKRLTDVLAITAGLPSTSRYVDTYLGAGRATRRTVAVVPPKIYVVHPGVVHTKLFPLNAFLFFWYGVVLYVARWMGSPWHPITGYKAAVAPVWLVLQREEALDSNKAEFVKWGSSTTRSGEERVKRTEVDGWGWDGTLEDDWKAMASEKGSAMLGKRVGRRQGAQDLTAERRIEFEELGAKCWREMEELRIKWEAHLKAVTGTPNGKTRSG